MSVKPAHHPASCTGNCHLEGALKRTHTHTCSRSVDREFETNLNERSNQKRSWATSISTLFANSTHQLDRGRPSSSPRGSLSSDLRKPTIELSRANDRIEFPITPHCLLLLPFSSIGSTRNSEPISESRSMGASLP